MNKRLKIAICVGFGVLAATGAIAFRSLRWPAPTTDVAEVPVAHPTFNEHIAPIIFENCAACHRPGESAPFSLLTYEDVRSRGSQIVDVTHSGYMPPWLPEPEFVAFADQRTLSNEQLELIARWVEQGEQEGDAADLPPVPQFTEGWQLGQPDEIIAMESAYTLPRDGFDVYRNFVIPLELTRPRFVQAMEMRFDNPRAVHHAFTLFDTTSASRELDREDPQLGYDGMDAGDFATSPAGQFISWQPGKVPFKGKPEMAFRLNPGTDVVLQVHMQPTGKPEPVRAQVGLHFSNRPPTKFPFKIMLRRIDIDIPAGVTEHVVEDSYQLPVAVDALAVLPHAHYLGKSVHAYATLPNGERRWLLRIDDWDFNWQGDYRYAKPMHLPRGSVLHMKWTYDNSTDNPRNPFRPARRVRYGVQTTDEMGELWLRVLPSTLKDRQILYRDQQSKLMAEVITGSRRRLADNPRDLTSLRRLYRALMLTGADEEALQPVKAALQLEPESAVVNLEAGFLMLRLNRRNDGQRLLLRSIELDGKQARPHYLLGVSFSQTGLPTLGRSHLEKAVELDSSYVDARYELGKNLAAAGEHAAAVEQFSAALEFAPDRADIQASRSKSQQK